MSDDFNMSMRKFLKQVGVTSQTAIEEAMRSADTGTTAGQEYPVTVVLKIPELGLEHTVTGTIKGQD